MSRTVTLALVDRDGVLLGQLPPFPVDLPYWQSVVEIVERARSLFGVELSVLRIISTEPGLIRGGKVTYLAEAARPPDHPLSPSNVDLADHPLRPDYAKPGGPARSLEWASHALGEPIVAEQQRTWNLSAIWRLETSAGRMWLKQVPRFFRHEVAVLSYLDQLNESDDSGRMLLPDIPGDDLYGASFEVREAMVTDLLAIQLRAVDDLGSLLHAGVPDLRGRLLGDRLRKLLDEPWIQHRLELAFACDMPNTLVHGDMHPGNVRGTPTQRTIIDWGDSFLGHPAFDIIRLTEDLDASQAEHLTAFWADAWGEAFPATNPLASVEALRPIAALRNALVYATFLADIEPSEHPYHAADVPYWLTRAQELTARRPQGQ